MPDPTFRLSAAEFGALFPLAGLLAPGGAMPVVVTRAGTPSPATLRSLRAKGLLDAAGGLTPAVRAMVQTIAHPVRRSRWTLGDAGQRRVGWYCESASGAVYCDQTDLSPKQIAWGLDGTIGADDVARLAQWCMRTGAMPDLPATSIECSAPEAIAIAVLARCCARPAANVRPRGRSTRGERAGCTVSIVRAQGATFRRQ